MNWVDDPPCKPHRETTDFTDGTDKSKVSGVFRIRAIGVIRGLPITTRVVRPDELSVAFAFCPPRATGYA